MLVKDEIFGVVIVVEMVVWFLSCGEEENEEDL